MDWYQWSYICPKNKKLNSPISLIDERKTITNSKNIVKHFKVLQRNWHKYTKQNLTKVYP